MKKTMKLIIDFDAMPIMLKRLAYTGSTLRARSSRHVSMESSTHIGKIVLIVKGNRRAS